MTTAAEHINVLRGMIESRCYTTEANRAMEAAIAALGPASPQLANIVAEMRAYGDRETLPTSVVLHFAGRLEALHPAVCTPTHGYVCPACARCYQCNQRLLTVTGREHG